MNQESFGRMDDFIASATQELFNSHGLMVSSSPPPATAEGENLLIATIGFTAAELRGTLVLAMDRGLAASSLPGNLKAREQGDEIVADWVGELSNQLLGRLKNRFGSIGIDIALSTPIVFAGKELRHYCDDSSIHRALYFEEGRVLVEFMASLDKDFEIPEGSGIVEASQPEGEALFF
jgi:CheY-specific phosphatase CheX